MHRNYYSTLEKPSSRKTFLHHNGTKFTKKNKKTLCSLCLCGALGLQPISCGVLFILILLTLRPASAQQPTGSLSGFVFDAANGEGLIGANVFLPGTTLGSTTNVNGYYVIPRVPVGSHVLQVRYLGYKPFSKGGFGAEYDGRLSSVLNITHLDGNREEFEGTSSLSLLSAKTTLQMPLGNIGSLSGSIRRTYFDQTMGKALDDMPDYYFYDGNVKAFFDFNAANKLALSGYGGRDFLNLTFNNKAADKSGLKYNWGNRTGSARWTHVFSPALFANFWLTGSEFTSDFHLQDGNITEKNNITDLTAKGNLEYHLSQHWITRFGFEQKNWDVVFRQTAPGVEVEIKNRPKLYSGYSVAIWRPTPLWEIEGGLRYNILKSDTTYRNFAPRFSAKYRLSDKNSVKAAFGIYHQYLQRIPGFFVADIWMIADRNYNEPVYTETKNLFNRGDGSTIGFEAMLKKDVGVVTGWLGYSFSRTQYDFAAINQGREFYPRHDRSHTVNLASTMDLGNAWRALWGRETSGGRGKWSLGVNFVYYTGQPYTEPGSGYLIGADPEARERFVQLSPTKINNIRFPYYSRLDLSLTWLKQYKGWSMSPYAQIFNVGNRQNVWFVNYDYTNGVPDLKEQYMFPFLPTLGVNFKF